MRNDAEFRLQCAVADHLRLSAAPGIYWFHPANGEARTARTGGRLKRMGVRPGVPDMVVVVNGKTHGLELKASNGRQSDAQRVAESEWTAAGGVYAVAHGIDEALGLLKDWKALPDDYGFVPARRRQLSLEIA